MELVNPCLIHIECGIEHSWIFPAVFANRRTVTCGDRLMSSKNSWRNTKRGSTSASPWARNCSLKRYEPASVVYFLHIHYKRRNLKLLLKRKICQVCSIISFLFKRLAKFGVEFLFECSLTGRSHDVKENVIHQTKPPYSSSDLHSRNFNLWTGVTMATRCRLLWYT